MDSFVTKSNVIICFSRVGIFFLFVFQIGCRSSHFTKDSDMSKTLRQYVDHTGVVIDTQPVSRFYSGTWRGSYRDVTYLYASLELDLFRDGTMLKGEARISYYDYRKREEHLVSGILSGAISGNNIKIVVKQNENTPELSFELKWVINKKGAQFLYGIVAFPPGLPYSGGILFVKAVY